MNYHNVAHIHPASTDKVQDSRWLFKAFEGHRFWAASHPTEYMDIGRSICLYVYPPLLTILGTWTTGLTHDDWLIGLIDSCIRMLCRSGRPLLPLVALTIFLAYEMRLCLALVADRRPGPIAISKWIPRSWATCNGNIRWGGTEIDGQTSRQTIRVNYRVACMWLKILPLKFFGKSN